MGKDDDINKKPVAPSLKDLSHVQVEHHHLFGLTNLSGKALMTVGATALVPFIVGGGQLLGFWGAVAGVTVAWPVTAVAFGTSIGAGLFAHWIGDFDDKQIDDHNTRMGRAFARARGEQKGKIQNAFVEAVSKADYDPFKKMLPHDALGFAVDLPQKKIDDLPAHIQLDVYRTKLDLEIFNHTQRSGRSFAEPRQFELSLRDADIPMEEKTKAYRDLYDSVKGAIKDGSFWATPIEEAAPEKSLGQKVSDVFGEIGEELSYQSENSGNSGWSWSGGRSRGRSSSGGIGGSFGGSSNTTGGGFGGDRDGFKTGGGIASGGFVTGGGFGSDSGGNFKLFEEGGSGSRKKSGGGGSDIKIDGGAAQGLLIAAGIAAALAAVIVTGFSIKKNLFDRADQPSLAGVDLPLLTKALSSRGDEIAKMYAPNPTFS